MSRRPAPLTQADIARALRAAKQAGAKSVEVRPDGSIVVLLTNGSVVAPPPRAGDPELEKWLADED
jgi:hypothetical protein